MRNQILFFLLLFSAPCYLVAEKSDSTHISFSGQVTAWGIGQFQTPVPMQFGGRFVPTLLGNFKLSPKSKLNFEASLNLNGSLNYTDFHNDSIQGQLKPYRVWLRYSGENWEVRAGLQKINFGRAKMFRPLMWFDAMDVRDPLQLTDGVYGVLGRYFMENNGDFWIWGLIGNKNPKGFERDSTSQWKPEIGARIEFPLGPGEIALSTHHRTKQFHTGSIIDEFDETRIGLDGKWDIGIGLWFETSVTSTETQKISSAYLPKMQDLWNVGADYTLPVGSGLGVTVEYFRYHAGDKFLVEGTALNVLGAMLTYPVSMLDNLSGMVFYLPDQNKWMNYLSWGRSYDNFSIYAIGYWNPDNVQLVTAQTQSKNMFAGKGIQIMLNYNF